MRSGVSSVAVSCMPPTHATRVRVPAGAPLCFSHLILTLPLFHPSTPPMTNFPPPLSSCPLRLLHNSTLNGIPISRIVIAPLSLVAKIGSHDDSKKGKIMKQHRKQ